jgi:hypothetical protein
LIEEDILFRVRDYQGVEVVCSRQHWVEKIVARHPDMAGREQEVIEAIAEPEAVFRDRDFPSRKIHVRRSAGGGLLTVAVVEYATSETEALLVTAFRRDRPRHGDVLIYGGLEERRPHGRDPSSMA